MGSIVELTELGDGVVLITMEDRTSRNSFSKGLIEGLILAFEEVGKNKNYKVVIMTGYENYFCCGGTKDELIAIYKGEIGFNDVDFFTLPLYCPIPVIAAMQGHGIGGGFVFGLYADFPILGRENIYTTNFMRYGFTPGMGGTMIIPLRLGNVVGNEMLFTAENYRGGELKERGVPMMVVPRAEVLNEAIKMSRRLADKPRLSLITLKAHVTASIKEQLPGIIQKELAMHDVTFHQSEVVERIQSLFGQ